MDRFEPMRTLVAAVDGGSLPTASRSLGIPSPTVSRRVSELEALGSQLVVRTSRKLLLTEAGTAYVASARRVLEELNEASGRHPANIARHVASCSRAPGAGLGRASALL
jgi:DNA-binding transcriptional LysR family regulator